MGEAYRGILEAAGALDRAGLDADVDIVLDGTTADRLLGDAEFQNDLLHPSRTAMPSRTGCASIGLVRVGRRSVRVYQRLT